MLATVYSAALQGIEAVPVQVEVNAGESGDPRLILVGLPDAAVKESDDRVFSALANSGYRQRLTRMTINLAPGDLRKEGPFYDLPIALGILAATGQIANPDCLSDYLIAGELSLSGATRPIRGALAMAVLARQLGRKGLLLPPHSAREAALVEGVTAYPVGSIDEAVRFLEGAHTITPATPDVAAADPAHALDFSDIKGQFAVRRAVEVAVAGGHNVIMLARNSP